MQMAMNKWNLMFFIVVGAKYNQQVVLTKSAAGFIKGSVS
jgi:hypothetical protein